MADEEIEVRADAESFRTNTEVRLTALEKGHGNGPKGDDESSTAGLIRTYETRIAEMERVVAANTSGFLQLLDNHEKLTKRVEALEALQPPVQ